MVSSGTSLGAVLLTMSVFAGCAGSSADTQDTEDAESNSIDVVNIAYSPETLEIGVDEEVVWTNKDEGVHHTVTSGAPGDNGVPGVSEGKRSNPDGAFDGDLPDASAEYSFTFGEAGTFSYFCKVHPSMVGEIVVR